MAALRLFSLYAVAYAWSKTEAESFPFEWEVG